MWSVRIFSLNCDVRRHCITYTAKKAGASAAAAAKRATNTTAFRRPRTRWSWLWLWPAARPQPPPTSHAQRPRGAGAAIVVLKRPYEARAVDLHAIRRDDAGRHTIVAKQLVDDGAAAPARAVDLALDDVAHRKARRRRLRPQILGRGNARVEAARQRGAVQILADKHELRAPRLAVGPLLRKRALKVHVHRVEHERLLRVRDREHALHPKNVGALLAEQPLQPRVGEFQVELARRHAPHVARGALVERDARDRRVVLRRRRVDVEELRARLQRAIEVEAADAEDRVDVDLRVTAALQRRDGVDLAQPRLDAHEVGVAHEVGLVEQQPVGERHLRRRLVDDARRLLLVEVLLDVRRVDQGDDAVEPRKLLDRLVDKEGRRHRRRVGHSRRLDDDRVEHQLAGAHARAEPLRKFDEVLAHRAADAAV